MCVPSFSFKTSYISDVCFGLYFKKVSNTHFVPILLSLGFCCIREEILHLSAHPFLSSLLSVQGVFLWCIFGVDSFLRNQVVFRMFHNPEIGQEPPEVFASVNKLHAYNQINTISHFTRSYCQLL